MGKRADPSRDGLTEPLRGSKEHSKESNEPQKLSKELLAGSRRAQGSKWPTWNLAKTALMVSIGGGFNFGYQLLITNPAQEALIQFLNDSYAEYHGTRQDRAGLEFIWGVIVSSLFWGATVGSLVIQTVADRLGRKYGIISNFVLQVFSIVLTILSFFTNSYILYTASRVLLGIAISISIGIGPMFIIECSPVACRGLISMSTGVMLQVGLVAGSITAMPEIFGTTDLWWVVYAVEGVLTFVVSVFLFCIPESPSFLMSKGKKEEAEKALMFYHGITEEETQPLLAAMKNAGSGERPLGLFEIFTDKTWLCGFLVGVGIMSGTILCGVAAVNAFAFEILTNVGLDPLQASLGNMVICIMAVIGVLASGRLVESWGRRPLLIYTFGGLAIINSLISGFMLWFESSPIALIGWCVVLSICCFNLLFAAGPGPICFFVAGELVGQNARAATFTWVNIAMNGFRTILLVIYFPVKNLLGGPISYFVLFFPPCAFAVTLCYFYLPETTGKTPEEARAAMKNLPRLRGGMEADPEKSQDESY
ncbi:hypothetical protein RB195_002350 [Necator americanus]|uniref:Major facilitator superfamily (MFS) profile domain-containing protein n=1 Tax=Necator americanus TaxID=51031 RepID=A0ABR1DJ46_NECAM